MKWTKAEIEEFDYLVEAGSSPDQLDRIHARIHFPEFIEKHGKAKCDAMFAHMEAGGAKEDFDDGVTP